MDLPDQSQGLKAGSAAPAALLGGGKERPNILGWPLPLQGRWPERCRTWGLLASHPQDKLLLGYHGLKSSVVLQKHLGQAESRAPVG